MSAEKFDLDQIRAVIQIASESEEIAELEVESPTLKVSVKKVAGAVRATATSNPSGHTETVEVPLPAVPSARAGATAAAPTDHLVPITAPMVGTFYRAANPDAPPLVAEGDAVEPGQTVCIIEAMKLFNEIQSEVKGRVVRILVENAVPVEFGQPLFLVDTSTSG